MDKKSGNKLRKATRKQYAGSREIVDRATGEVLSNQAVYRNYVQKSIFVTMYLDDENVYEFLEALGNSGKVWAYVLKNYNDKTGLFYFSTGVKDTMVSELGLSIGTVRGCISEFTRRALLLRVLGSEYMVNPRVFYKGLQVDRDAMIETFNHLLNMRNIGETQKSIDSKTVKT